jgi:hypothetical protein
MPILEDVKAYVQRATGLPVRAATKPRISRGLESLIPCDSR